MSIPSWFRQVVPMNNPEDLREAMRGADLETVQLKSVKFQGSLTHTEIGNVGMTVGRFNSGIRHTGPMMRDRERVAIGTLLECRGDASHWWEHVTRGVVGIFPCGVESDAIYSGGAVYVLLSVPVTELTAHLKGERLLADPAFWGSKRMVHNHPHASPMIQQGLSGIVSSLEQKRSEPSAHAIDFLRRSILECFTRTIAATLPMDQERPYFTAARLVSEAEQYVDRAGARPVHISELCSALNVSRRSLHRAFADALDMGPVAYLRRRRLARVHNVLSQCTSAQIPIADLAFEHGFPEPARFSAYYRSVIGESPSETRRLSLSRHRG